MTGQYPSIRQWEFGPLTVKQRSYGIDYYWRDRFLFVSAPGYIGFPAGGENRYGILDLRYGVLLSNRALLVTPKWWRRLFREGAL